MDVIWNIVANALGALIGGYVAYRIAKMEINRQAQHEHQQDIIKSKENIGVVIHKIDRLNKIKITEGAAYKNQSQTIEIAKKVVDQFNSLSTSISAMVASFIASDISEKSYEDNMESFEDSEFRFDKFVRCLRLYKDLDLKNLSDDMKKVPDSMIITKNNLEKALENYKQELKETIKEN
ncbi:hypothetical protein IV38_GL000478 [Lactobacillus selangorensis]|uniref:Uncharacterized protein n=1 Tax=Lactobacillus selangorensis TaxID=81857 RepID=A0A0R2G2Y3_9LACO|nr:hypothetical protein [Lactobacillus selangorensis]KRN29592.1 hypothetical protein IV38_GL000478 [Lactobacillus selangorensis]KRN33878.1 hypothetical protein IV40_GL000190 [Lactobacillus selangorensis]